MPFSRILVSNMTTRGKNRPQRTDPKYARAFTASEDQCVWMKAKVVNFKLCNNAYDCGNCAFDKALSEAWAQARDLGST